MLSITPDFFLIDATINWVYFTALSGERHLQHLADIFIQTFFCGNRQHATDAIGKSYVALNLEYSVKLSCINFSH